MTDREAKLEVINEFEKEIKYVKENEKYDDFNPIVDIDLCENVLNIMKLQNEKIKKLNIKNKELSILINMQEKNIKEQQIIIDTLKTLSESAKPKAIKEFAERLNDRIINFPSVYPVENATLAFLNGSSHRQLEILEIIDKLVKEIVGKE